MLEDSQPTDETSSTPDTGPEQTAPPARKAAAKTAAKKAPAKKAAAKKVAAKKATAKKTTARKAPAEKPETAPEDRPDGAPEVTGESDSAPARKTAAKKTAAKRTSSRKSTAKAADPEEPAAGNSPIMPLFKAPEPTPAEERPTAEEKPPAQKKSAAKKSAAKKPASSSGDRSKADDASEPAEEAPAASGGDQGDRGQTDGEDGEGGGARRRRRRGGRRRRKSGDGESDAGNDGTSGSDDDTAQDGSGDDAGSGQEDTGAEGTSRRRRRRRRPGDEGDDAGDDTQKTVTRVRKTRSAEDQITAVTGSTRLEAKKQRRREGREAGRRRAPIVSEAEFLARREAVDRVMVIRQRQDLTQIAVLEDKVLVEHYVARESQTSLIGNVYLGRVQNVLPSMEAAFIDIGKGRNAVLYAGEVNWSALGHKDGQPRKIESVLSSGQSVLVQVTKDPVGHKGARLTSQISLAGRFLVYVADGTTSGISRKLPDTERTRLKALLKEIVPDTAGVIARTAAEGASEDELTRDVERLRARWEDIEKKAKGSSPQLLYGEPDLTLKVVRDLFTEDFSKLVIEGDDAWDTVQNYVAHVAPDLEDRLERHDPQGGDGSADKRDVFAAYRIDEQIAKGLDRKVWLPSGGSLVIDRTEAMTVVDVNTGKFTGSGGNLEETVTKNNLEAAEEIVRQLRLRDIGGIIVVDFIDMVLESNRDLVLRRLVECLGRDRTRHQVAEVTSLGLVQMTRKRIGTGLLEAFSATCEHCQGRGVVIHDAPVEPKTSDEDQRRGGRRGRGRKGGEVEAARAGAPSPKDVAAMAKAEKQAEPTPAEQPEPTPEPVLAEQPEPTPEPVLAEQPEPTPAEPVEVPPADERPSAPPVDTAPRVVTRTRRSASRPGGATTPAPAPIVVAEPASSQPTATTEPADEPEKPKVVTRTRSRSATRAAGPPAAEPTSSEPSLDGTGPGTVDQPPGGGSGEPGTATSEPGGAGDSESLPVVEHVPIKKKGSRKR